MLAGIESALIPGRRHIGFSFKLAVLRVLLWQSNRMPNMFEISQYAAVEGVAAWPEDTSRAWYRALLCLHPNGD